MTALRPALDGYLATRRALGYKLHRAERPLAQFLDHIDAIGAERITTVDAVAWATLPSQADPSWWGQRLSVVRGFAAYLHTLDPTSEVPPADVLPQRSRRATPYLYSDDDIAALMNAAATLSSPLRVATFTTLIGLLAVTGMRIGEAIGLDRDDLDWPHRLLTVRDSKFGKSRQLPLHPTTVTALRGYLTTRDRLQPDPSSDAVFISTAGTRLLYCNVHSTWLRLVARAGLQPRSATCRPRPHDLRHTFAVRTILDCYRADGDPQAVLPLLSTWLGHVHPANTYWYLSCAPELLALAGQRLQRSQQARP